MKKSFLLEEMAVCYMVSHQSVERKSFEKRK